MKSKNKIINRVAKSSLLNLNISDYAPKEDIELLNIKIFLSEDLVLKERVFRENLKNFDFSIYKNKTVAVYYSSEYIIPMWAFMLISTYLNHFTDDFYYGSKKDVFQKIFLKNIEKINVSVFKNKKVIINGCSDISINEELYLSISKKIQPYVNSLMFGEACSSVPIYKNK